MLMRSKDTYTKSRTVSERQKAIIMSAIDLIGTKIFRIEFLRVHTPKLLFAMHPKNINNQVGSLRQS